MFQKKNANSLAKKLASTLEDGGWRTKARPEQLPPAGDWNGWIVCAGRGFGKTRCGAEWVRECVERGIARRIALIAPTAGDARDVITEGPAGILAVSSAWCRPTYEPSKRRIEWPNGAVATLFSAEESDRLRGPQHDLLWCDELAAMQNPQDVWDMAQFGLRLGKHPRWLVTTTPKPVKLLRELLTRVGQDVVLTSGSTFDNSANLAPSFLAAIKQRYEGTRLGRQELHAELLSDTPGALWNMDQIDANRLPAEGPMIMLQRIVIAVDPAVSNNEGSDETGIIVAGKDEQNHYYVLEDLSGRYSPDGWARKTVEAFHRLKADRIVIEVNQGGAMVRNTLLHVDPNVPIREVHANRGKVLRAEPVAALYEQGKVSHAGNFPKLEDQMCSFTSDFNRSTSGYSPDRVDALVYALTSLSGVSQRIFGWA
jgi:predicted phage terminase large subunit-like protein